MRLRLRPRSVVGGNGTVKRGPMTNGTIATPDDAPQCASCGRKLVPAPATFDGVPTTVGYYPCACGGPV